MNNPVNKTGIFGGAFSPPHAGHIRLAEEAAKYLKLRKLLIVPTFVSPHKDSPAVSFGDRMEMCRLAFSDIPNTEICDIESSLGGKSFTINTIRELKSLYPDETFYLIIGGDMLFGFEKWYKYESILKEVKVCAAARDGDSYADMLTYAAEIGRVKVMPIRAVEISSTALRRKIAAGEDVSGLIKPSVMEYIKEHGLYSGE